MLCEGEAPNVFFDDGESASVSIKKLDKSEYNLEKENIFSAAHCCPMAAIEIELENGLKIDSESRELDEYFRRKPNCD